MAISKEHRFEIPFEVAFPRGLVQVGEIGADLEYQSEQERTRSAEPRQRVDRVSGKRQWKVTVTDPDETRAKRASFDVIFLADVQPVPTAAEVLPGMRPIELDGVSVQPKVMGTGEFKYQGYVVYATGIKAVRNAGKEAASAGKDAVSSQKAAA